MTEWTHTEVIVAGIVIFCVILCFPVFGWQNCFAAIIILGSVGILYFGASHGSGWGIIPAWLLLCLLFVPCLFLLEAGEIQPNYLGGMSGDVLVSQSIGQWGLGYLREGEPVPAWNPCILGGMPTEGSLLFSDQNPISMAYLQMHGYRAEWENKSGEPIRFTGRNWLGNSAQMFLAPLSYAVLIILALFNLVWP